MAEHNYLNYATDGAAVGLVLTSCYSTSKLLKKLKSDDIHRQEWLKEKFPHVSSMFAESKWFNDLMNHSVISPSWTDQFMSCLEGLIRDYSCFRTMTCKIEQNHNIIKKRCRSTFEQCQGNISLNELLECITNDLTSFNNTFCEMSHMTFIIASKLETCIARFHYILTLLSELKQLCHAYNIFWKLFGSSIFMKNIPNKSSNAKLSEIDLNTMFENDLNAKKVAMLHLITRGISEHDINHKNELILSHVRWWTILCCSFLPSMRDVASFIGIDQENFSHSWKQIVEKLKQGCEKAEYEAINVNDLSKANKQSLSKIYMSSSIMDIASSIAITGWKEGFMRLLQRPFDSLLPSVNSAFYIPTSVISLNDVKTCSVEITRRFYAMIGSCKDSSQYCLKSCTFFDKMFSEGYVRSVFVPCLAKLRSTNYDFSMLPTFFKMIALFYQPLINKSVLLSMGFENSPLITGVTKESRETIKKCMEKIVLLANMSLDSQE